MEASSEVVLRIPEPDSAQMFNKMSQEPPEKYEADDRNIDDDKECTSIVSAISNEEASILSEIVDHKSFCPRKNSDGEDMNGHIGHIDSPETDTYPNSDALQGESLMDDISSMLGNDMYGYDQDSMENTFTDDTTLFNSDVSDLKTDKPPKKKSFKRDSADKKRRNSRTKSEEDAQFGFENRAFMTQHVYLDNRFETEPVRYCSLAQFVEGNDIARRSFKRTKPASKLSKTEANVNRQSTLTEESEGSAKGSKTSLNKLEKEISNLKETVVVVEEEVASKLKFPQVSVIVEPPSPDINEQIRSVRVENLGEIDLEADLDMHTLLSKSEHLSTSDVTSNNSSNSNLLGIDPEQFLTSSPGRTRRISCCSMLNPNEAAALAAAAATSKFYAELDKQDRRDDKDNVKQNRRLPIINPLVRLPTWPSKSKKPPRQIRSINDFCKLFSDVTSGTGFISKCLLANADTLCAAVSPLIDPDETLLEGFFERCVMNNYFGIGIDAKISLDFHHKREEHPEKCRSRAKNYMWYGVLGSKQWLQKTYKNLEQRVQLECDGQRIPLPSLQGIVILNIPRYVASKIEK